VEMKSGDITLGIDERDVDAVILDLATPWLVIPHAYEALKPSGSLVSFSPTIDQVVKTTEVLRENNFVFIETIELMMRSMQVERGKTRPQTLMTGHTGYITHARKILKPAILETVQMSSLAQEVMPEVPIEEADVVEQEKECLEDLSA